MNESQARDHPQHHWWRLKDWTCSPSPPTPVIYGLRQNLSLSGWHGRCTFDTHTFMNGTGRKAAHKDAEMLVNEENEASQAPSQMLHPGSRALFTFWETTRGAASAPRRDALDLKKIGELVPNLFIIEPDRNTSGFRWRLAGTGVCNLYRRELTGTSSLLGWDSFETDVIKRFFGGVIHGLQPCLLRFRLFTDLGQLIGAEFIGLPIQANGGGIHVFGGVFPFRDIQTLTHRSISAIELSGARSIWTEHLPGDRLAEEFKKAEQQPFLPFQVITGGRQFR